MARTNISVTHVSCFMSINAIDFAAQPHLHSNKATAEIVATVVVRVCACVCVYACVCVCCLYSLCHMQIAATAASRCPVKGLQLPSIYADFRRLRIVQRVFGVFYLASLAALAFLSIDLCAIKFKRALCAALKESSHRQRLSAAAAAAAAGGGSRPQQARAGLRPIV